MPTFDLRAESHWLCLLILLGIGLLDVLLAWLGGNQSTLSRVFMDFEGCKPYATVLMSYSAAVLVWHLCVPTFEPLPSLAISIIKAIVVCAPILYVFVQLARSEPGNDACFIARYGEQGTAGLVKLMVLGTLAGWLAARWGVSQHVSM